METITDGIDLAKQVFSVCVMDGRGRVAQRHELKREALRGWFLQLPAGTVCEDLPQEQCGQECPAGCRGHY